MQSVESNTKIETKTNGVIIWRNTSTELSVDSIRLFPLYEDTNIFAKFGGLEVIWGIRTTAGVFPARLIYDQGKLRDYTLFSQYQNFSWFNYATENLLIANTKTATEMIWSSTLHDTFSFTLNMYVKDAKARFIYNSTTVYHSKWIIQYQIPSSNKTFEISWNLQGITEPQETTMILQDYWMNMGLYQGSNGAHYITNNQTLLLVPNALNGSLYLGHITTFSGVAPIAIDTTNNLIYYPSKNITESINIGKIQAIHDFGFLSSILLTAEDKVFEFINDEWRYNPEVVLQSSVQQLMSIDIGAYVSATTAHGLSLQFFGKDDDGDGIPSVIELYYNANPFKIDSDGDKMLDNEEIMFGLKPNVNDANSDLDGDSLSNKKELILGTDPGLADTDLGGANDGWEVRYNMDPLNNSDDGNDDDHDGLSNALESKLNTSPYNGDSDFDNIPDYDEWYLGLNPLYHKDAMLDYDDDGITNYEEYKHNTDPYVKNIKKPFSGLEIFLLLIIIIGLLVQQKYQIPLAKLE